MYQFNKVDRYFRWGIRSFLAGGKKKLEKSSAVLLMESLGWLQRRVERGDAAAYVV
jgi:hypothetical protein